MASAFVYQFTVKEFSYLLFKKKICPKCGGKMRKQKCSEIVDGARFDSASAPLYTKRREVKHYYYSFTCKHCGEKFILTDLVKEER